MFSELNSLLDFSDKSPPEVGKEPGIPDRVVVTILYMSGSTHLIRCSFSTR